MDKKTARRIAILTSLTDKHGRLTVLQSTAARMLGVSQPMVSLLLRKAGLHPFTHWPRAYDDELRALAPEGRLTITLTEASRRFGAFTGTIKSRLDALGIKPYVTHYARMARAGDLVRFTYMGRLTQPMNAIARDLGVSPESVQVAARRAGCRSHGNTFGTSLDGRIAAMLDPDGRMTKTLRAAAAELGCSRDTIMRVLRRLGARPSRDRSPNTR